MAVQTAPVLKLKSSFARPSLVSRYSLSYREVPGLLEERGILMVSDGERAALFPDDIDARKQSCPNLFILDINLPRSLESKY